MSLTAFALPSHQPPPATLRAMATSAAPSSPLCANCHQAPVYPGFPYCSKRCGREAKSGAGPGLGGGSRFGTAAPAPTVGYPAPPYSASASASSYPASYPDDDDGDADSYNPPYGSYPDDYEDEEEDDGMCRQCGVRPRYNGHDYCGRTCGRNAKSGIPPTRGQVASSLSLGSSMSGGHNAPSSISLTQPAAPPPPVPIVSCKIVDCRQGEDTPGSGYCSDRHRKHGVAIGLDPPCLLCKVMPRVNNKTHFCGRKCQSDAMKKAPILLEVDKNDPRFADVSGQFTGAWKHTNRPPRVARVYKIILPQKSLDAYDAYKAKVESEGNFSGRGMEPGNERRRWHGTRRQCRIGDDGKNLKMCSSATCSVCNILKSSFDVKYAAVGMFGKGIYASATSSKSDTYTRGPAPGSPYKSMFLNRVVVGKGKILTAADNSLRASPAGHHSVIANPGSGLNYDELIVYNNDAIRPSWFLLYDAVVS